MTYVKTQFTLVAEFNHDVLGIAPRTSQLLNNDEADLLVVQLHEEAEELQIANDEGDYIDCVDALVDSIYFAMGGLYRLGITSRDYDKIFLAVHEANLQKNKGANDSRPGFTSPDAIKPDDWVAPEESIARILELER